MNNVVGQAMDDFQSVAKKMSHGGSNATLTTTASKQSNMHKAPSMDSQEHILNIL